MWREIFFGTAIDSTSSLGLSEGGVGVRNLPIYPGAEKAEKAEKASGLGRG